MEEDLQSISIQEGDNNAEPDIKFKLIVIGNSSVGKSKIVTRFCENKYTEESKATVGVELQVKTFKINTKTVKVEFWDTAGQEKFKSMAAAYYKNCQGAIVVYDITNRSSFEAIDTWIKEVKEKGSKNAALLIIGNKCDLESQRDIKEDEALEKAKINSCAFMETSAAENIKIRDAFYRIIKEIYNAKFGNDDSAQSTSATQNVSSGVSLNAAATEKKGCC